jgi:hypothetical protein
MDHNYTVLLLTGTIDSSGINFMKRSDTNVRLNDYTKTILKWIRNYEGRIVFVENSDFPKNKLGKEICESNNFEYLSYKGQNFSRNKGKGYGEINSFEYAFSNSLFLKEATNVVKCNGRYFFKNLNEILFFEEDLIGNFRKNLDFMDSRVFGFKTVFFKDFFINYKEKINDSMGVYFEHALALAAHEMLAAGGKWKPLNIPLIIEGYSGTNNYKYNNLWSNLKIHLKFHLNNLLK